MGARELPPMAKQATGRMTTNTAKTRPTTTTTTAVKMTTTTSTKTTISSTAMIHDDEVNQYG
eukprot:8574973-Pyramimonas_sp.AAC.1